jgi:predicted MFS family arabinose efflux permease
MSGGSAVGARPTWIGRGPRAAFRWTAYVLAVTSFSAAVPTPLYPLYAVKFDFSPAVLGLVFAAYTPGVLLTLLLVAPQAERIGRRNLLYLGMTLTALGAVVFALAPSVSWLAVARVLSGLAVGATTSVATVAMNDLEPFHDPHHIARVAVAANFGGFAVGVVMSGLLVQYGPWTMELVFLLPIAASAVGVLAIRTTPETAPELGGRLQLRVQRISVPPEVRRAFWVAAGGVAACYAIYGLFAALVPSYLRGGLQIESPAAAGAVVALMFGTAAVIQLATSQIRDRRALLVGFPFLILALAALVFVLTRSSVTLLVLATAALGAAVGLTFMGSATLVDRISAKDDRGEVLAGFYSVGYLAVAVPTIGVALASESLGLAGAGILFGSILMITVASLYAMTFRTPTPAGGGGRAR